MLTPIAGKTVVVTGGSKGIGKGIAMAFAARGANVLIVARSDGDAGQAVEDIRAAGGSASHFCGNVASWDDMAAMAEAARERYGALDMLCANAGIFPSAKIDAMTEDDWDLVNSVNAKGMFLAVKACLPHMKAAGGGRVILTSSITGPITGYPGWAHYGATKAAMLGFMRTAAIEFAPHGITINAVLPGNILTEGLQGMGDDYLTQMAQCIPLKKLGTVEDIANAALFFASAEAAYITGQTIVVDGGQTLPESPEAMLA